ncbi:glycosyltransferase [Saccharicrinis fermentans]|uniref:Undecaprenyl-phosphate 4-deoxy-4-formamido-L-arabinose transferase n=1 Tax=Saccharicrinis fermentans DSM 9555 = JCM 21142 TaxID=869213 RepID=W7YGE3_9BACT|nr:glycosyltransferase [Saccharicrinis fermentans]GAF01674.1 undecaprenyl-phosphate 4-deoxy-4-formamido-L-arabinose transferase [Saccharicrinis fermentans DSM 9555 = JCM 21142]
MSIYSSREIKNYWDDFSEKWIKYRKKRSYYWNSISKYCNYFIHPDCSILEVGCGQGDLLDSINGKDKTGIDFSPKMIEIGRNRYPHIQFHEMAAENITLDKKYDVIILSNIIGVLPDVESVFLQLAHVAHEKTRIIVTYYNRMWEPFIRFAEIIGVKRRSPRQNWLSSNDIQNLLYLSGFESYKENRSMLLPYYIPLISPFMNRFLSRLPLFNKMGLNQFVFARPIPQTISSKKLDQKYTTTVVIPARNETKNIEHAIARMPQFGKSIEIIFVEGNSTDDTWEAIKSVQEKYKSSHNIRIMQQDGKGKGDAVRKGFEHATGDILMILDADLTVPPEDLPKFYNAISAGKGEFINGVRLVYPMEKHAMRPLNTIGNHFFSKFFTYILERPIKDTLCGTKVMFRSDYQKLAANRKFFGEFDPFGDFDLLFGAYKLNLKIIDLPIRYRERKYGDTNISRFKHGIILLRMVTFATFKIKFW